MDTQHGVVCASADAGDKHSTNCRPKRAVIAKIKIGARRSMYSNSKADRPTGKGIRCRPRQRLRSHLVGWVGIENNDEWNFKDLRGMARSAKSLKRNDGERKGILIAPSKLPRFSSVVDILKLDFSTHCLH